MAEVEMENQKENEVVATALAAAAAEIEELPKTIVRRLVKEKLSQLSPNSDLSVLREAQEAFCESARIFIHYLSATANDICKDSKRQIINAEDVFKALDEMEFEEFVEPLRASLEEFRQKNSQKKLKLSKESNGVVKGKETPQVEEEDDEEDMNTSIQEFVKKNAAKKSPSSKDSKQKSTSTKESKGKGKINEEPPAADVKGKQIAADSSDEVNTSAA